jgi:hypothetical protein
MGLFIAAGVLVTSAVLLIFLPRYRFGVGADRAAAPQGQPQVAGARR